MKLIYTNHLKLRLKIRKIPFGYPKEILEKPDDIFFDVTENRKIAIKKLKYNRSIRNMMVAYDETEDGVEIVTIHPISDEKILNRRMSGRWIKNNG